MTLAEAAPAARETASPVAIVQRPPQGRRNRPRPRADLRNLTIRVVTHHHPRRVAGQASGRLRGNVYAIVEDRLARRIRIREHGGIDVDDDLVALARGAGLDSVVEHARSEQT